MKKEVRVMRKGRGNHRRGKTLCLYDQHLRADSRKSRQSKLNPLVADWLEGKEEEKRVGDMIKSCVLWEADHAIERAE